MSVRGLWVVRKTKSGTSTYEVIFSRYEVLYFNLLLSQCELYHRVVLFIDEALARLTIQKLYVFCVDVIPQWKEEEDMLKA